MTTRARNKLGSRAALETKREEPSCVPSPRKRGNDALDEEAGVSELEQRRLKNLRENAKFLAELKMDELKSPLLIKRHPIIKSRRPRQTMVREIVTREPISLRSRAKNDGADSHDVQKPSLGAALAPYQVDINPRKPQGKLQLLDYWSNKDPEEPSEALPALPKASLSALKAEGHPVSLSRYEAGLEKMHLKEERIAKVVRSRICSLAVHPSESDHPLVAAGDKGGMVGLWRVGSEDVFTFDVHVSAVYCLMFSNERPDHLYSCSYDGSLRSWRFESKDCEELYRTQDSSDTRLTYFDFESPSCMLVSSSDGSVIRLDERASDAVTTYALKAGALKTVSVHAQMPHLFATASSSGLVEIWDTRRLAKRSPEGIAKLPSSRTMYSAFFSPLMGHKLLTTSADDTLRIYDTKDMEDVKLIHSISHNNHTGRWLTTFKAAWHPLSDDMFAVGSMSYPRRVEIFNGNGMLLKHLYSDYLSSVCSINAFHPTMDILAGGNSSGRVHVFMSG